MLFLNIVIVKICIIFQIFFAIPGEKAFFAGYPSIIQHFAAFVTMPPVEKTVNKLPYSSFPA